MNGNKTTWFDRTKDLCGLRLRFKFCAFFFSRDFVNQYQSNSGENLSHLTICHAIYQNDENSRCWVEKKTNINILIDLRMNQIDFDNLRQPMMTQNHC